MVFVVYTFSPSMVWFCGVYTMEAKNEFRGVHHGRGFWIFVVYTMEGDFAISWCIHLGRGFWISIVITLEGDFEFSWCTPWKEIFQIRGVFTIEAKNGFCGVHH